MTFNLAEFSTGWLVTYVAELSTGWLLTYSWMDNFYIAELSTGWLLNSLKDDGCWIRVTVLSEYLDPAFLHVVDIRTTYKSLVLNRILLHH